MQAIYEKVAGLTDLDWSELADQSGAGLHPDQLRKMGAGIRLAMEAGMLSLDNGPRSNHDLQKLRDLRNEMNAAYRADARSEALREAVIEAAQSLPPVEIRPVPAHGRDAGRSLVVAMGDFHYGAEWAVQGLYGEVINSYSPEIFEGRMERLLGELLAILDREGVRHIDL